MNLEKQTTSVVFAEEVRGRSVGCCMCYCRLRTNKMEISMQAKSILSDNETPTVSEDAGNLHRQKYWMMIDGLDYMYVKVSRAVKLILYAYVKYS